MGGWFESKKRWQSHRSPNEERLAVLFWWIGEIVGEFEAVV